MLIIFATCHLLAMSSVLSNPIIYGFLNDNFKQSLYSIASHCNKASAQQVLNTYYRKLSAAAN